MGLFTNYQKKTDEQLMISIKDGDHKAFGCLYDRYAGRLNGFFRKMLWGDSDLAEDQVHEIFAKIIERPELFRPDFSFKSWVFQVANNMCKNVYRKHEFEKAYRQHLHEEGIELPTIQRKIDEELQLNQVNQVLEKLAEEKKSLFLLRYQQEMTVEDLATTFDLPSGTIKSRLYHIRQNIIEILNKEVKIQGYE